MAKPIKELNVHERIIAVMSEMGGVKKDGTVAFGKTNYQYTSEAAFIAALRPLMLRYRLTIFPVDTEVCATDKGMTRLIVTYRLTAADFALTDDESRGESYIDIVTAGEGADASDKGVYKAMTGAFKYALRQSFLVSTGDDAEKTDAQGNKTAVKTPLTALRDDMKKAGIEVDTSALFAMGTDFTTLARNVFIGRALGRAFKTTKFDIESGDFDTLVYASAIRAFIKNTKAATSAEHAQEAYDNLVTVLNS